MEQVFKIVAISERDAYEDEAASLVGRLVILTKPLEEWPDGWMHGKVTFKDTGDTVNFFEVKLEPLTDVLGTIKETVMRRDGCTSEEFDLMLVGAIENFDDGQDPEEVIADWFGLEPDYVMEFLEIAAAGV